MALKPNPEMRQLPPAILRDRLLTRGSGGFLDFLSQKRQDAKGGNSALVSLGSWLLCLASCYLILKQPTVVRKVSLGHLPLSLRLLKASGYHILTEKL